ncbi:MAG: hypothetical protein HC880_09455 [Bacteroidia bacterium]|nr:hypothetical protein [Bacteroidia bacterium]
MLISNWFFNFIVATQFSLSISASTSTPEVILYDEYIQALPQLQKLAVDQHNSLKIREILVRLDYENQVVWHLFSFERAGRFKDLLRIEGEEVHCLIPEWCLLLYLEAQENLSSRRMSNTGPEAL